MQKVLGSVAAVCLTLHFMDGSVFNLSSGLSDWVMAILLACMAWSLLACLTSHNHEAAAGVLLLAALTTLTTTGDERLVAVWEMAAAVAMIHLAMVIDKVEMRVIDPVARMLPMPKFMRPGASH